MKKYIALLCAILSIAMIFCSCDLGITEDETEKKAETSAPSSTTSENITEPESEPTSSSESESETLTQNAPTRATYMVTYIFHGEPVENATVQLCNGDLCLPPMFTDANGTAIFENVKIAEYSATITTPDGQSMEFDATDFELYEGCYVLVVHAETEG